MGAGEFVSGAGHTRMQIQARGEGQVALLVKCNGGGMGAVGESSATCDREGTIAPGNSVSHLLIIVYCSR